MYIFCSYLPLSHQGLTCIVGPPGTGKTDVAVQIITNLYHNFPTQKIVIIAHSNAALNDIFEKIRNKDIDPRHMLRLGAGEKDLAGLADYSKQGRVDYCLQRRLVLLQQVQLLATSIGVQGDIGSSCELAEYFYNQHIKPLIQWFESECSADFEKFPFAKFYGSVPADSEVVSQCFMHVSNLFSELSEYRAFELLRSPKHRGDYLVTKQARIVAMTCTHAAMTRRNLVDLGFKYDSLLMEEAAQVLEVETFIPMLLQNTDSVDGCRLKRVVLLGDHHQLPPVVQHMAFKKYSHLDQSLFTRFIRLGVPTVMLDQQGRARAEIAALYAWRYQAIGKTLGNLPLVSVEKSFLHANVGFRHTFQMVNVEAFQNKGEFCPQPFFYQNQGEAEYVVAVYQYMRLLGYPAEKISILTTYNGQKNLIRDVLAQRCHAPIFGKPGRVATVDKYQGQQNDYVLLSLVRTESVGHLRDVRRLVVAMSRARLGLYVFGRQALFENCFELAPMLNQLYVSPQSKLELVPSEQWPHTSRLSSSGSADVNTVHVIDDVTAMGILVYQMIQATMQQTTTS